MAPAKNDKKEEASSPLSSLPQNSFSSLAKSAPSSSPHSSPSSSSSDDHSPPPSHIQTVSTTAIIVLLVVIGVAVIIGIVVLSIRFRKFFKLGLTPTRVDKYNGDSQESQQSPLPSENHIVKIPPDRSPASGDASKQPRHSENSYAPFSRHSVSDLSLVFMFPYEELAVATNDFSENNLLGEGGFGFVHRGVLQNGKEVAVKQLKNGSSQGEREFHAEVEIISRIHHRHLVSLVGCCIAGAERMLVYEFVPNKTLEYHLHGEGRPTMGWATRVKIALGSAKGLAYLHEDCNPKIIHRDIKAANILLDFNFEAKVADFGLAKVISDVNTHVCTRVMGTFGYMAPEYASSGKLTDKSDVFSFGVMLLELITGQRPVMSVKSFMDEGLVDWARPLLARALESGDYDSLVDPKLQKDYDPIEMGNMIACAAACVRYSSHLRPSMSQVVHSLEKESHLAGAETAGSEHKMVTGSHGIIEYNTIQYKQDMKNFRKLAMGSMQIGGD